MLKLTHAPKSALVVSNIIFNGLPECQLNRMQTILNASARLIFSALHHELHWLRVKERIEFKLCVLNHRCLHGTAPTYLA